jgi:TonB family protein
LHTITANENDTRSFSWFPAAEQLPDSGEIDSHHTLLALLNRIYSGRLTGKLQLVFGRLEKQLFFDGGQVVFATSSDRQDSLGEMMLRAGALTQSQFEEASALVQTGQRFGSAIAEMGVYGVEEIVSWVQRQLIQITASVLDYPAGRYYFFGSLETNVVPEIGIPVPLGKLLLEAVHKAKDLPLDKLAEDGDFLVNCSPDPLLLFQAVDLEKNERHLLGLISQPMSAKEIVSQSGLQKAKAARALYALLLLGFVVGVASSEGLNSGSAVPVAPRAPEAAPSSESEDGEQSEEEIRRLLEVVEKGTYYDLLGVAAKSPADEIQQSYNQLVRKFHPDRHMGQSERVGLLQDLMGRVTTAYKTLIDKEARASYDKELGGRSVFNLGPSKSETPESVDECFTRAKQCLRAHDTEGSIVWLRKCVTIAPAVAEYHTILARSLGGAPRYQQEAIQEFERAIELDARNTSVYFQFAELYEAMRLPEKAVGLYQKILEIDPEHSKARKRLHEAESASNEKRTEEDEKAGSLLSRLFHRKAPQTESHAEPIAIPEQGTTELPAKREMKLLTASRSGSSAEASADKLDEPPVAPNVEEVETLKREVETLREQLKLKETLAASQQAPELAAIAAPDASAPLTAGDAQSGESNWNGATDETPNVAVDWRSLPIEDDPIATHLTAEEQAQSLKPSPASSRPLPKTKWRFRAGGNFTPGFRAGLLRLALATGALAIIGAGAGWYEHWTPWKAGKKPSVSAAAKDGDARTSVPEGSGEAKEHLESSKTEVASDPRMRSAVTPMQTVESPAQPLKSSGSVAQRARERVTPAATPAGKRTVVRPTANATDAGPIVASAVESVMIPPKLIKSVRAVISPEAVTDFETGNVVMDAVVDTSGEVHFMKVISGPPSLRNAAVEAVKQYRYEPATRNGQPVPAHVNITIHFRFES